MSNLLEIENLESGFDTERGLVKAVDGLSFELVKDALWVSGESGCGKTVTAMSIVDLLPKPAGKILQEHTLHGPGIARCGTGGDV